MEKVQKEFIEFLLTKGYAPWAMVAYFAPYTWLLLRALGKFVQERWPTSEQRQRNTVIESFMEMNRQVVLEFREQMVTELGKLRKAVDKLAGKIGQ